MKMAQKQRASQEISIPTTQPEKKNKIMPLQLNGWNYRLSY